jgi:hypothetical protein
VKIKVALLCLAGLLVFSATAEANFLPFGTARKFTKQWTQEACDATGPRCVSWKVGHCARINAVRIDCVADLTLSDGFCVYILENRLKPNNFVHQRRRHTKCG